MEPPSSAMWRPSKRPPPIRFWKRQALRLRDTVRKLRPRLSILSIVHAGGGGTLLTNQDLMRALAPRHDCYIMACGPDKWVLSRVDGAVTRLEEVKFGAAWKGGAPLSKDREAAFADLVARREFDIVHVRSLLGCGPEILTAARRAGRCVVLSFHDFTAICPTVQLLDAESVYCAGVCTRGDAECPAPAKWFSDIARLKHSYVHEWRARVALALPNVSEFVTTSPGAAALLTAHFPMLEGRMRVIEHGRDIKRQAIAVAPRVEVPARVVVLGVLGAAKGREMIEALVARNAARGAPFEFHFLGGGALDLANTPGVVLHGDYAREDLMARLRAIGPSFSLIASIWPETYSHTLTESWAAGIPVLASGLGAPSERIRRLGGGWLLDPRTPEQWLACLDAAVRDPEIWTLKAMEIRRMHFRGTSQMAADYLSLYRALVAAPEISA